VGEAWAEHAQDAEHEVARVVGANPSVGGAHEGEVTQGNVAAVTILGVAAPSAKDPLGAICFAHVLLAFGGVRDQVDALHLGEGGTPVGVPGVGDHLLELVVGQDDPVEPRERDFVAVGDLNDGKVRCAGCAAMPVPWAGPVDDEPVPQRVQEAARSQVEAAYSVRPLRDVLPVVLEGAEEAGPALTVGDEDCPVPLGLGREAPGGDVLGAGVLKHARGRDVLRAGQSVEVIWSEAVADHANIPQGDRRFVLQARVRS
jgi:hypothetical protein